MDFIERLKEVREKSKVSQTQVAEALKISRQAYNNYERGIRHPDIPCLIRIADYFGVTTDYLLMGEKSSSQSQTHSIKNVQEDFDMTRTKYGFLRRERAIDLLLTKILAQILIEKNPEKAAEINEDIANNRFFWSRGNILATAMKYGVDESFEYLADFLLEILCAVEDSATDRGMQFIQTQKENSATKESDGTVYDVLVNAGYVDPKEQSPEDIIEILSKSFAPMHTK